MAEDALARKVDLRSVLAVLGSLVGLVGLAITVREFVAEQPKLQLRVDKVELVSDFDLSTLPDSLADIEAKYGEVTGRQVIDLRDLSLGLAPGESNLKERLTLLVRRFQEAIEKFDQRLAEWTAEDINYDNGIVTWPDGNEVDLREESSMLVFLMPTEVLSDVRASISNPSSQTIAEVRDAAFRVHSPNADGAAARKRVAEELRNLRIRLVDALEERDRRVVAVVTVENRSRLPNSILGSSVLRIYRNQDAASDAQDIYLELSEDQSRLDGYSGRQLAFQSRRIDTLDAHVATFVASAFAQEYEVTIGIEDMNEAVWTAAARLSDSGRERVSQRIVKELDRLVPKIV